MAINGSDKSFAFMEFPLSMSRQDAFPLDKSSVFYSLDEAKTYAKTSPLAYVGQHISVVEAGTSTAYQIKNEAGELEPLGAAAVSVATDEEVGEMFDEVFGTEA
ncbi:hypothetical protein NE584_00760 [Clostridium sp. DFI.5.61]|uniref:hypothetical protein n=1 Tax=Clostridium sp. DFI.5.61 TaxID=2965279 RepID=UPI0021086A5E|nr:hypothetical protein [Clostridium sp. DFI.5.61]MCB5924245.1 hypothetical protein [bacterium 210820-DFI.5.26]MCQ5157571.1 hypothetical protein [Clostridium sp. DFI.5.61]